VRVAGVLIVALAACYSPSYEDCEIMCAAGTCPSGFSCELGVCRIEGASGPCGDPNGDNDSDGLINSMDNCPDKANPDQANEDRDMRGDVCDPCPIKAEPAADLDSDADGVGDGGGRQWARAAGGGNTAAADCLLPVDARLPGAVVTGLADAEAEGDAAW